MPNVSEITLIDLGFGKIRQLLQDSSNSTKNKKYFSNLAPTYSIDEINQNQLYTSELLNAIYRKDPLPNNTIPNSDSWMKILGIKGSKLNNDDFKDLHSLMNLSSILKKLFNNENFKNWTSLSSKTELLTSEKKNIEKIFDDKFQIKKDASKNLMIINDKIDSVNNEVKVKLNSIFKKCVENNWLQENKLFWQNGRTVLPIISKYKRKIKGVIYSESSTNQTSFIEPIEIINLNNEIYNLNTNKRIEENRILLELTSLIYKKIDSIKSIINLINNYDKHHAISKLAFDTKSVRPNIADNNKLNIEQGINPILQLSKTNPVPLNIKLNTENMVIITGPNAGGKSVVLKTIGLFSIMAYSNLFIPAKKINFPIIDSILSDIGDRQSIENDLSTFSAHIKNLSNIISKATSETLILIDEIGTGTDPMSGAAISISILEEILSKKSIMIGTTHLGEIKNWTNENDGAINARMIFDSKKLIPTFELELGFPGSSYCFEVAKKMGLKQKIINRSKQLIDSDNLLMENLIIDLEKQRSNAILINENLEKKLLDMNQGIDILNKKIESLDRDELENKKIASSKIATLIEKTEIDIKQLLKELHVSKGDTKVVKKIKHELNDIKKNYSPEEETNYELLNINKISISDEVYIPTLNSNGTIISINKKTELIKVACNGMKIQLNLAKLTRIDDKLTKSQEDLMTISNVEYINSNQIDLRGLTEMIAVEKLQKFIDKALLSNLNNFRVIHGIGNGILKNAVHKYLSELDFLDFDFAHPNSGGYGVTELRIKNS